MARKICPYCVHYHYRETVYDGLKEVMPGVCVPNMKTIDAHCVKHPEICKGWWERNGNLRSDNAEEMDCFEFTEEGKMLDEMIEQSKELLAKIKDRE